MVNIVIFGINSMLRERVEHYVNKNVNIVAYSDNDKLFKKCVRFGYKPFWTMDELADNSDKYNYILVCEEEYIKWVRKSTLLARAGVEENKIIPTMVLSRQGERIFTSTLDDFIDLKKDFYGMCFGMCYSRCAFLECFMTKEWFKFSLNGSDINTHETWLTYLFEWYPERMKNVKKILLELPYYTFDWDMQYSGQVYYRMVQFDRTNNYQGFLEKNKDAEQYIKKYRVLKQLLQERTEQIEQVYTEYNYSNERLDELMERNVSSIGQLDMIWEREFDDAVKNNKQRLRHICVLCEQYGIKLNICVFPLSPEFKKRYTAYFENKKERFYTAIEDIGIGDKVYDFCEYKDFINSDFKDLTHLNIQGSIKLTNMLKEIE